jgi:hypothetical protein
LQGFLLRDAAIGYVSPATRDDHEGDTVGEHDFVAMLSPRWSLLAS